METTGLIRVLIADDQALIRNGFALLLGSFPNIVVVGEAANGIEAYNAARALKPDVILMDIRMPQCDGIEATRLILGDALSAQARIIILTTFDLDEYVYNALKAGASGFLLKDIDPDELVHAIEVVAAGDALLAPSITRRLISD
ncbi:MAG: response regulator transcription factor, partial [Coriobacteriales bacterium]|nr:response regulator transcription factor [Coriobacteriales bacterium]